MRHSRRQLRDARGADAASTASATSITGRPAFPCAAAPGAAARAASPPAASAVTGSERAPTASVSTAECADPKHDFWCSTYSPLALGPALARVLAGLATKAATGFWSTDTAAAAACAGAPVAHSAAIFCSADTTAPSWAALRTERPILAIPAAPIRPNSSSATTRSDAHKPA